MLTSSPEDGLREADVVFVATKRFANAVVLEHLVRFAKKDVLVVLLQNGLEAKAEFEGMANVVECVVNYNVVETEVGKFRWGTKRYDSSMVLESSPLVDVDTLVGAPPRACKMHCTVDANFMEVSSGKIMLNMINAPNALAGCDLEEFMLAYNYRLVWATAIVEAQAVFRAMGIAQRNPSGHSHAQVRFLHRILMHAPYPVVFAIAKARGLKGGKASMLQDLENRSESTEVVYISGKIVKLGAALGVGTPVNAKLVELVNSACAKREGSPCMSPDALLAAVGIPPNESSSCVIS
jgi:2-dehydropantoate 2-reductase